MMIEIAINPKDDHKPRVWFDQTSTRWRWCRSFTRSDEDQGMRFGTHGSALDFITAFTACLRSEYVQQQIRGF